MPLVRCANPGHHVLSTRYVKTREQDMGQKSHARKYYQCGLSALFLMILLVCISLLGTGNVQFSPQK